MMTPSLNAESEDSKSLSVGLTPFLHLPRSLIRRKLRWMYIKKDSRRRCSDKQARDGAERAPPR